MRKHCSVCWYILEYVAIVDDIDDDDGDDIDDDDGDGVDDGDDIVNDKGVVLVVRE